LRTETNVIAGIDTHRKIVDFVTSFGTVKAVGVERTGSYGAELTRILRSSGITVLEVNRPNRAERRLRGKSDPLDAYQAAQSVIAERGTSVPKAKDGPVECLRMVRSGRSSAVKAHTAAINQIKGFLVSAPDSLRAKYRGMGTPALIAALRRSRPSGHIADPRMFAC
jgi:transposase